MVSVNHVLGTYPEVTMSSLLFELCGIVWLTATPGQGSDEAKDEV